MCTATAGAAERADLGAGHGHWQGCPPNLPYVARPLDSLTLTGTQRAAVIEHRIGGIEYAIQLALRFRLRFAPSVDVFGLELAPSRYALAVNALEKLAQASQGKRFTLQAPVMCTCCARFRTYICSF